MSEKYKELLEQYDVKVLSTFRSRGTFQCETEQGLALLKEYHGSLQKLALEYEWKEKLANAGFLTTDRYFLTKEESLVTYDRYRTPFVLKHYFKGRECDCRNLSDVAASCRNLAFLHKVSSSIEEIPFENLKTETTSHLFERKNRELRSIRKFIGKVRGKNDFELLYMNCFDSFYKEASAKKMLVSGDNLNEDYDEVSVMKKLAVSGGIEADEVYMDHTGLNTYDTIVHSLEFFNKGSTIVIVTQSYHLYRALYLAQRMGLNAYGVSADSDIVYRGQLYREFREMAARLKDFWYGITKPELPEWAKGIITCKSKKFDVYYA